MEMVHRGKASVSRVSHWLQIISAAYWGTYKVQMLSFCI